jgi:hypothetical protein
LKEYLEIYNNYLKNLERNMHDILTGTGKGGGFIQQEKARKSRNRSGIKQEKG